MAQPERIALIHDEGQRLLDLAKQDPERTVPHYPDWTLRDLVRHTARIHAAVTVIFTTLEQDSFPTVSMPERYDDPLLWYEETLPALVEAMGVADAEAEVFSLVDDRRLWTWERRMVIETGVHRWDAQQAIEEPEPLRPLVSVLGFDEFNDRWLAKLGDVPTLRVRATDLDREWILGTNEPTAEVIGDASSIYLRLMARPGAELPSEWAEAVDSIAMPKD